MSRRASTLRGERHVVLGGRIPPRQREGFHGACLLRHDSCLGQFVQWLGPGVERAPGGQRGDQSDREQPQQSCSDRERGKDQPEIEASATLAGEVHLCRHQRAQHEDERHDRPPRWSLEIALYLGDQRLLRGVQLLRHRQQRGLHQLRGLAQICCPDRVSDAIVRPCSFDQPGVDREVGRDGGQRAVTGKIGRVETGRRLDDLRRGLTDRLRVSVADFGGFEAAGDEGGGRGGVCQGQRTVEILGRVGERLGFDEEEVEVRLAVLDRCGGEESGDQSDRDQDQSDDGQPARRRGHEGLQFAPQKCLLVLRRH